MDVRSIVELLDQRIITDPAITPALLAGLSSKQRELGLVHGDRPTCPFLRPHILSAEHYNTISSAAALIASAFEKLVRAALRDPTLLNKFGLTKTESHLARIDPGYSSICVTSRLDAYCWAGGFSFLEYNAESPAGVGDQAQLDNLLLQLPHNEELLQKYRHWIPEPHRRLLAALVAAYRETGGEEDHPHIAIVDWSNVPTRTEFHVLKSYFESQGHPTTIADPKELRYNGFHLYVGNFRIDILYKRVVIHEFLEQSGLDHPLVRAYTEGRICMANSFRSKIAHKKVGFAILSDPAYEHLFSDDELDAIRRHIPWTRAVEPGITSFHGVNQDLLQLLVAERQRLVLKPNDDYGGHGVFLGWETTKEEWEDAIRLACSRPYVVQERVQVDKIRMPMYRESVIVQEMFIDLNPFLFHNVVEGALIRVSASSLLNVTSGGGQTSLLVLED
jgi:hypothetical protein